MDTIQPQGVITTPAPVDPLDFSGASVRKEANGTITQDAIPDTTPEDTPAAPAADDLTPEERALAGMDEPVAEATPWSDDFKKLFKDTTGYDGPDEFKANHTKLSEEHRILAEQAKELKGIKSRMERVHPHVLKALELEQQKAGSGQKYLRSLPDIDMLSKDAAKLSDKEAVSYVEDHGISDEDWAKLSDPDADPNEVAGLKKRIAYVRMNGEDLHRKAQGQMQAEQQAEAQAQADLHKRYTEGVATTIANAKTGALKAHLTQAHIEEIQQGKFISRFFEDDGFTPKPDLLNTILKAELYDSMKEATKKAWFKKGREEGLAEQTATMPTSPRQVGRAVTSPTQTKNPWAATLDAIEASI